jgi:hypothetical protein
VGITNPAALAPMSFPINYDLHIHTAPEEVYLVVNYNSDRYQQLSFGISIVQGLSGTGNWYSGSYSANIAYNNLYIMYAVLSDSNSNAGFQALDSSNYGKFGGGLFFSETTANGATSHIHSGLDGYGWINACSASPVGAMQGQAFMAGLLHHLPNLHNMATVLLPIKTVQIRSSGRLTELASLVHARYTRNDFIDAGAIITFGQDDWKVYPFWKKSLTGRSGLNSTRIDHSGTFAYAIRYTGT